MITRLRSMWSKFSNREYRETFVDAHVASTVAAQVQTMRVDRGLTQAELAEMTGMKQSRISIIENPNNRGLSISTLQRFAAAFDVALVVRFVPYSDLARWSSNDDSSKFSVSGFHDDRSPADDFGAVTVNAGYVIARLGSALYPTGSGPAGSAVDWLCGVRCNQLTEAQEDERQRARPATGRE